VKGIREYAQQRGLLDFDACRELQKVYEERKCFVSRKEVFCIEHGKLYYGTRFVDQKKASLCKSLYVFN